MKKTLLSLSFVWLILALIIGIVIVVTPKKDTSTKTASGGNQYVFNYKIIKGDKKPSSGTVDTSLQVLPKGFASNPPQTGITKGEKGVVITAVEVK